MTLTHLRPLVPDLSAAYRFSRGVLGPATTRGHHDDEWEIGE